MTKKPLSTISFNSETYLRSVLDKFVSSGKLQSWMYVKHLAEEDTKKDHIHLLLMPSSVVNPVAIRKEFIEPSFDKNSYDLGCLPFVNSKISDWLLYSLHYEPYLNQKGLSRLNHYQLIDVITNESMDYVNQCFSDAVEGLQNSRIGSFLSMAMNGSTFGELLASGIVPPNHVIFYEKLFRTYKKVVHLKDKELKQSCITNDFPI